MIDDLTRTAPADLRADLAHRYRAVRGTTEDLCRPLVTDDYQVQSVPEASPPKWHLAHVSWFFETFVLQPFAAGYRDFHPRFGYLFNSYYRAVGPFHARGARAVLSRPTVEEVYAYRAHVDDAVGHLFDRVADEHLPEVASRVTLGLNHEQQHQELLLMDVKRNFGENPLLPAYREDLPALAGAEAPPLAWHDHAGGIREIGWAGDGFAYDNEVPRHRVLLEDFRLASRPVTNGEYREFIAAGGYAEPTLWLSDGWTAVEQRGWRAPLYWREEDGVWSEFTLAGLRPLDAAAPVCHLSFFEADAYARWAGKRLPSEAELEVATAERPLEGNFLDTGLLQPRPARGDDDGQWFGDVWEWTRSAYGPYPGSRPLAGALGEYNAKFMANQFVLRGGCCVTPRSHLRATYRNFFYPHERWPFTGLRLAADGG